MAAKKQITQARHAAARRRLTSRNSPSLPDVPPETEWFANIDNDPHATSLPQRSEGVH